MALLLIVFLWQIPHFMAIAWMFREDYASAGFPMLPVVDGDGRRTGRQALLYAAALVPASLVPGLFGRERHAYLIAAGPLGRAAVALAGRFASRRTRSPRAGSSWAPSRICPSLWVVDDPGRAMTSTPAAVNASLNAMPAVLLLTGYV